MHLVDTNVVSELMRRRPSPRVEQWFATLDKLAISSISIAEVAFGLTTRPSPRLSRWFESFVDDECAVHDVTRPIAHHAGMLRGQLALRGAVRSQSDMLIAATAALHGLTLATRNVRDFADCGISLVNPFD